MYCLDKFGVYEYFLTRFTIMLFMITLFVMMICCCGWRAYDSGKELQKKMSWIDARRGAVEGDGDEDGPGRPRTKWTTLEGPCNGQLLRDVSSERVSENGQL